MTQKCAALFAVLACAGVSSIPAANALVGKSRAAGPEARHTVMVLKRQRNGASFCSGAVVAPKVILTAAHCVYRASGIAIYAPIGANRRLYVARRIAIHPGFRANAIRSRRRSIDLALVETRETLPSHLTPVAISNGIGKRKAVALRIAGFGFRREGSESSGGQLRVMALAIRQPHSSILLWMRSQRGSYGGACTGDSGGPIFASNKMVLVGITVWARGTGKRRCGELTQAIRIAPQRAWIASTLAKWNRR